MDPDDFKQVEEGMPEIVVVTILLFWGVIVLAGAGYGLYQLWSWFTGA